MFTHREGKNGFAFLFVCNVFGRKIVIYLHVTPGVTEYFPWSLEKNDIRSHLRTVKVSQTSIPTEKDLILAHTGKLNEDGTNMTICPRPWAEHGMFAWRPSRKCAHPGERHWRWAKKSSVFKWSTLFAVRVLTSYPHPLLTTIQTLCFNQGGIMKF